MNLEWDRAGRTLDAADAIKLGNDAAQVPNEWIDEIESDPLERARWRQREFRKEL